MHLDFLFEGALFLFAGRGFSSVEMRIRTMRHKGLVSFRKSFNVVEKIGRSVKIGTPFNLARIHELSSGRSFLSIIQKAVDYGKILKCLTMARVSRKSLPKLALVQRIRNIMTRNCLFHRLLLFGIHQEKIIYYLLIRVDGLMNEGQYQ